MKALNLDIEPLKEIGHPADGTRALNLPSGYLSALPLDRSSH
jgi:hypothetical protein